MSESNNITIVQYDGNQPNSIFSGAEEDRVVFPCIQVRKPLNSEIFDSFFRTFLKNFTRLQLNGSQKPIDCW